MPPADKRPAHRPSRCKEIIEAATKAFSRDGYVEVRVDDIGDPGLYDLIMATDKLRSEDARRS